MNKETPSWIRYLHNRISENRNFVGIIEGKPGSGKSYTGLSICEMVDPSFSVEQVVFTGKELMNLINNGKLKSGSAILFEEVGIEMDSHKWQSVQNQMLKYLFETFRHRNFILLMTTPYSTYLASSARKLIDATFETVGIDRSKQTVKLKPLRLQYSSRNDKTYFKYLRIIKNGIATPVKRWNVPKPSAAFIKEYEVRKRQFTDALYKRITKELNNLEPRKTMQKYPAHCEACGYEYDSLRAMPGKCPRCQSKNTKRKENLGDIGGQVDFSPPLENAHTQSSVST